MAMTRQNHRLQLSFDDPTHTLLWDLKAQTGQTAAAPVIRDALYAYRDKLAGEAAEALSVRLVKLVMADVKLLIADMQAVRKELEQFRADFQTALQDEAA